MHVTEFCFLQMCTTIYALTFSCEIYKVQCEKFLLNHSWVGLGKIFFKVSSIIFFMGNSLTDKCLLTTCKKSGEIPQSGC